MQEREELLREGLLREGLELLVMDEADLLFSFGYEEDVRSLLPCLPPIHQTILLSATLSDVSPCRLSGNETPMSAGGVWWKAVPCAVGEGVQGKWGYMVGSVCVCVRG